MNRLSQTLVVMIVMGTLDVFAQEQASKPAYQEGDFWQYEVRQKDYPGNTSEALNGIYEIIYAQGRVKAFSLSGTNREEISVGPDTSGQNLLLLLGGTEERVSLKFPLSVGQKWTYQYQNRAPGAKSAWTHHGEVNVTGVEQVATVAGTFKAFRLQESVSFSIGPRIGTQRNFSIIYFFSPDTRSVIKSTEVRDNGGTREIELIKFGSSH